MGSSVKNLFNGAVQTVTLTGVIARSPERGHAWIVLGGYVHFITGIALDFFAVKKGWSVVTEIEHLYINIPSATASLDTPLFSVAAIANGVQSQWIPYIITDDRQLTAQGDATNVITVQVLDFLTG